MICNGHKLYPRLCSFIAICRSPSQSQYNFTRFSVNFLITFSQKNDPGFSLKGKPFLLVVLGDFNAKLSPWHDKDSSTSERISVEIIMSQFGYHETINEPTTDLIFTLQPNLSVESGTQPSLCPNFHDQIIFASEVWHHQDSNVDLIRRAINEETLPINIYTKKFSFFNKTVLNTLGNFIPNQVIVCEAKDPPWFNRKIKSLINEKIRTSNAYDNDIIVNCMKS